MEDYFDGFSEDITKWEIIREMIDLDLDDEFRNEFHKTDPSVQLLPRQDVILYGSIPKMEQRIYTKCKECSLVFNPRDILSHKTCSGKAHLSSTPQNLKKKVKSKGNSSKKSHSSLPSPPHFKIQLQKLVPGRSKDIHQLIAERKATKEKELKHGSYMSPNGSEEKDVFCQNTSYVPIVATIVSTIDSAPTTTYVPIMPKTSTASTSRSTATSILTAKRSENMEDYFDGFSEDITKWEVIREMVDLDLDNEFRNEFHKTDPSVQLLPRQDVILYGSIPKMEQRIYTKCKECSLVFNPRDILSHKTCSGKAHLSSTPQNLKKKVKSKGNSSKKSHSSLPSPPHFKIQLQKLVPGRSKDIHQLIAERKATKEKELKHGSYMSPNGSEEKDVFCQNTSYVPIVATIVSTIDSAPTTTYVPIMPKTSTASTSRSTATSILTAKRSENMEDYFDGFSEDITKWEVIREMVDLDLDNEFRNEFHKTDPSVQLLPRQDVILYGSIPKMEQRIYTKCKECSLVFNPRDILSHKTCSGKAHLSSTPQNLKKKVKSKGNSSKKSHSSLPPPPLFKIQLRKLVPGRSKDIHQLIAERKAAKEKELKHGSYMSPNGSEEKDVFCQNTSYVPIVATIVSTIDSAPTTTYVPIMPKTSTSSTSRSTATSILTAKQLSMTDAKSKSTKTLDGGGYITSIHNNSQDSAIGTVPVVYMPMSPISVVSPIQFVQIGKNMICLESPQSAMSPPLTGNQSVFLTIPNQSNNQQSSLKMYKSHPKPVAIPSYGTKKVGGAIILSNQHVECQRNDIRMAMNTKRETVNNTQGFRTLSLLNHTNTPHRPNILKVKSANKVNCKRPAVDKLNSVSESKQLRLGPNVNGFILQSEISETADAPQSNNCIQEKIALLNMK